MNFLNLKKKIALGNNIFASKHFQNVVATRSPRVLKKKKIRVLKVLKNKGRGTYKITK
jgi:hypothetical protein